MAKKRPSREEIARKLLEGDNLHASGKSQAEIARTLRISGMTYHRWRKARSEPANATALAIAASTQPDPIRAPLIEQLKLENSRLRHLVTELSLEKVMLQEIVRVLKGDG
jgi:transcriptional regulator with XRE-family HTH domain